MCESRHQVGGLSRFRNVQGGCDWQEMALPVGDADMGLFSGKLMEE